jgi:hypothetical protein
VSNRRTEPNAIKLLTIWAAWRLVRALATILIVAAFGLQLLGGASQRGHGESVVERLQHTLQKAFQP